MKILTFLSLATFASQVSYTLADSSVCSSGLYAALAPLETYAPAVSYCKGQAGKATVTVTASAAAKVKRVPATTASTKTTSTKSTVTTGSKTTTTATTLKTTITTTSKDAKASSWSSLVQQAQSIVATFCSCAGYPATITTTTTAPAAPTCNGGGPSCNVAIDSDLVSAAGGCGAACDDTSDYGQGCVSSYTDASGTCIGVYICCPN